MHLSVAKGMAGNVKPGYAKLLEYRAWDLTKNRYLNTQSPVYHHFGGIGVSKYPPGLNDFIEWCTQVANYYGVKVQAA